MVRFRRGFRDICSLAISRMLAYLMSIVGMHSALECDLGLTNRFYVAFVKSLVPLGLGVKGVSIFLSPNSFVSIGECFSTSLHVSTKA